MRNTTKDRVYKYLTGLHEGIFRASRGRVLGQARGGLPIVRLTTKGRRSGQPRTTMLMSPVQDGGTMVLVASFGGDDRHPSWFLNLRDDPDVEVTTRSGTRRMRARIAGTEEKAQLWPRVTAASAGYAGYQEKTTRDIPLVILEPVPPR
jgi:deazaflavin-dependent oxidoreductase (nitroreductase family)